jgi:hypothetical protein
MNSGDWFIYNCMNFSMLSRRPSVLYVFHKLVWGVCEEKGFWGMVYL